MSSGEASGDHYTAALARTLCAAGYGDEIWGMGGGESRHAGINIEWDGERLQLLGFTEVLSAIPSIFALRREMVQRILERRPEAVVVVDSPDYHMRLIAKLRGKGYRGKIFYISPPAVWAWRSSRANDLRATVDECLPLFKFEHDYLLSRGCKSYWVGNPLLEEFSSGVSSEVPEVLGNDSRLVAFLPGSRASEVNSLLPMMEDVADRLAARGWHPVFSVAPGLNQRVREMLLQRFGESERDYYEGAGRDLMAAAKCAVGASGTITVESLLLRCFMIVTYKVNPLSAMLAKLIIKTPHFAMANILAGCEMFPELIQDKATADNIYNMAVKWLDGGEEYRAVIRDKMDEARKTMGEPGVYRYWCSRILEAV